MAGYLDQYGAGEERREKAIKTVAIAVVVLLVAGGVLYFLFKNYRQERQVGAFFETAGLKHHEIVTGSLAVIRAMAAG